MNPATAWSAEGNRSKNSSVVNMAGRNILLCVPQELGYLSQHLIEHLDHSIGFLIGQVARQVVDDSRAAGRIEKDVVAVEIAEGGRPAVHHPDSGHPRIARGVHAQAAK